MDGGGESIVKRLFIFGIGFEISLFNFEKEGFD